LPGPARNRTSSVQGRISAVHPRLRRAYPESPLYIHDSMANIENPGCTPTTPLRMSRIPVVHSRLHRENRESPLHSCRLTCLHIGFTHRLPVSHRHARLNGWTGLNRANSMNWIVSPAVLISANLNGNNSIVLRIVVPALLTCKAAALEPPRRFAPPLLTQAVLSKLASQRTQRL